MIQNRETTAETAAGISLFLFLSHVFRSRFFSLFASLMNMAASGGICMFGMYSAEIKKSMGYDQSTLNLLGFCKDLGANFGVLSGLLPAGVSIPPWFLLITRASLNSCGYLLIWLAIAGKADKPELWIMCLYFCLVGSLQNSANTAVLETCQTNFPNHREIIWVLMKGFLGLSVAILSQIYLALYGDDRVSLILFLAWLPAVICIVFVCTIRTRIEVVRQNETKILFKFLYVFTALALFLTAMGIAQKLLMFSQASYGLSAAVIIFLLLLTLAIVLKVELVSFLQKDSDLQDSDLQPGPDHKPCTCSANIPAGGEDHTILKNIFSMKFMILFVIVICGIGTNLTVIDNLGQIAESLGYPTKTVNIFVSMVSFWSFIGRMITELVVEKLVVKYQIPHPWVTAGNQIFSCVGYLLIAFPVPNIALYISSVIIGLSYGSQLTLLKPIIRDLFGPTNQVTLFNIVRLGSPLGSFIFNVEVVGSFYDREALQTMVKDDGKELTCIGKNCFETSFFILTIASSVAAFASIFLGTRTKNLSVGCVCNIKIQERRDESVPERG